MEFIFFSNGAFFNFSGGFIHTCCFGSCVQKLLWRLDVVLLLVFGNKEHGFVFFLSVLPVSMVDLLLVHI